jgi:hypothetical protein
MTRNQLLSKWAAQAEQMQRWQAWVNGAELCAAVGPSPETDEQQ